MKRLNGRMVLLAVAGLLASFAGTPAQASDIVCSAPVGGPSVRCDEPYGSGVGCETQPGTYAGARKESLICGYTMLSERYARIYAEQQRMLHKGTMQAADIAAWRARRDACDSVRCLDSVFHQFWRERDAMQKAPGKPAPAVAQTRQGAAESPGTPAHLAASRPLAPEKGMAPSTPASAPGPASVEPVVATAPAPRAMPDTNPDVATASTVSLLPRPHPRPVPLMLESLVSGLAVLVLGAGFVWNRRRALPQAGQPAVRGGIAPVMMIAYGLFLVNALLLPFTIGLR